MFYKYQPCGNRMHLMSWHCTFILIDSTVRHFTVILPNYKLLSLSVPPGSGRRHCIRNINKYIWKYKNTNNILWENMWDIKMRNKSRNRWTRWFTMHCPARLKQTLQTLPVWRFGHKHVTWATLSFFNLEIVNHYKMLSNVSLFAEIHAEQQNK